jgi:ribosome recycling factor
MLSGVVVEVYGTKMPLNQVASVSAPEPSQILVTPFDPHNIAAISAAIRDSQSLGLNPSDDGRNVRVPIPALNEERRRDIVRTLNEKVEEARITLRNIREEARKAAKIKKEAKELSEDDVKRIEKGIDDDVAKNNERLDEIAREKEAEIMKV